ncbi:MAG: hypothetical protein NTX57_22625 [Armatimonadetes bacterium]|nr:hypothetical protein [Armatimonadota bacterium]
MFLVPCLIALTTLIQEPTHQTILPSFTTSTQIYEVPRDTKVTRENLASLPNAKLVLQPQVASLSGFEAKLSIGDTIKYPINEKMTGTAHTGWSIAATSTEERDNAIWLIFRLEQSQVTGYFQHRPQISSRSVNTTCVLKSGEKVLVPFGKGENKTELYALVTVERNPK